MLAAVNFTFMDNNEPLLHFGDENIEETNNNSQSGQANNHIVFNSSANESAEQKPAQKPAPAASPVNPAPAVNPAQQPSRPIGQPSAVPQRPQQPARPAAPKQPTAPKQPQKTQGPNAMFGKKNLQITLTVVNGAGVALPKFKIDNKEIMNGQEITFSESRDAYDVTISADGYKDRRIQITHTDLQKGEKRIMLASQLQSIVVSFNTPDGIKRGSVDIDQSSAIYEFIKDASHTDTPLNELQIGGVGGTNKPSTGKVSFVPYLIALAIGLVLGIAVTAMFNSCDGDSEKDKTEVVSDEEGTAEEMEVKDDEVKPDENEQVLNPQPEETAEQTAEAEPAEPKVEEAKAEPEPAVAAMADADVQYLKANDRWTRDGATTDDGKRLLAAFCSGNIDYIIGSNAYNSLEQSKRNGYYNQVLKDLQKIKGQSNCEDAKVALRDACKDGNVSLRAVLDRIHPMLRK